jgi:hypothetical protein
MIKAIDKRLLGNVAAATFLLSALNSPPAQAACPTYTTLTNGTTADAIKVMDNFNYVFECPNFTGNVGIGMTPSNVLDITRTQNAQSTVKILNASNGNSAAAIFDASISGSGTGAVADYRLTNGVATAELLLFGSGFTTSGIHRQNGVVLYANGAGGITFETSAGQPIYFATSDAEVARFNSEGELLLGSATDQGAYRLQVNSQIWATSATIATSDLRLKNVLGNPPLQLLDAAKNVPTIMYTRKDRPQDGERVGYGAQTWQQAFRNAGYKDTGMVMAGPDGRLSLDENAVQSLKIAALERANADLEARLARLENVVNTLNATAVHAERRVERRAVLKSVSGLQAKTRLRAPSAFADVSKP